MNGYSVPHKQVHQTLTLLADNSTVRLLNGETEVTHHRRCWDKGQQIETQEHIEALVAEKRHAREQQGQTRLRYAAPSSVKLLERAAERHMPLRTLIRELNQLLDTYGSHELEISCQEVLEQGVVHSNAVRLTLQRRREEQRKLPALAVPISQDPRLQADANFRSASLDIYQRLQGKAQADPAEQPEQDLTNLSQSNDNTHVENSDENTGN